MAHLALQPALMIGTGWDQFGLVDSGHGRKLERYGPYRFIRPEAQALWAPRLADWSAHGEFVPGADEDGGEAVGLGVAAVRGEAERARWDETGRAGGVLAGGVVERVAQDEVAEPLAHAERGVFAAQGRPMRGLPVVLGELRAGEHALGPEGRSHGGHL